MKKIKLKLKKRSNSSLPKLVKSLRDDEAAGNKAFREKIEVREEFFFCNVCPKFSTASKMKARCHALSCGKNKKRSRFRKSSPCLLCGQVFGSKKSLKMHHKADHPTPSYSCSTCQKQFSLRQNYKRHLAIHQRVSMMSCPNAQCDKVFNRKSNLLRHMKVHKLGGNCVVEV